MREARANQVAGSSTSVPTSTAVEVRRTDLWATDVLLENGIIQSRVLERSQYLRQRRLVPDLGPDGGSMSEASSASSTEDEDDEESDDPVVVIITNVEGRPQERFGRNYAMVDDVFVYLVESPGNPQYTPTGHRATHYLEYRGRRCQTMMFLSEVEATAPVLELQLRMRAVDSPPEARDQVSNDVASVLGLVVDVLADVPHYRQEGAELNQLLHCICKDTAAISHVQSLEARELMAARRMECGISAAVAKGHIFERYSEAAASITRRLGLEDPPAHMVIPRNHAHWTRYVYTPRPATEDRTPTGEVPPTYILPTVNNARDVGAGREQNGMEEPFLRVFVNVGNPCSPPPLQYSFNFQVNRCTSSQGIFNTVFAPMGVKFATHCLTGLGGIPIDGAVYSPQTLNGHKLFYDTSTGERQQCLFLWLRQRSPAEQLGPIFDLSSVMYGYHESRGYLPGLNDPDDPPGGPPSAGGGGARQTRRMSSGSTQRSRRGAADSSRTTRQLPVRVEDSTCESYSHRGVVISQDDSRSSVLHYREEVRTSMQVSTARSIHVMAAARAPASINCGDSVPMSPLRFRGVHLSTLDGGTQRILNAHVLGDTGAGVGLASPQFVQKLRAINAGAVETVQEGPLVSAVSGVSPNAPHCIDSRVCSASSARPVECRQDRRNGRVEVRLIHLGRHDNCLCGWRTRHANPIATVEW